MRPVLNAVLLALVLGVGCGKKEAIMVRPDGELVDQGNLSHHHGPPLVEMLPPIGLIGSVAVVAFPNLIHSEYGEETSPTVLKGMEELDSTSAEEREDALLHLADHKEKAKQAGPKAVELLNDDSAGVRTAAIKLIVTAKYDTQEALAGIGALASEEKDEDVRSQALDALKGLGADKEHAKAAAKLLVSKEERLRELGAIQLAEAGGNAVSAETELLAALKDKSAYVRMNCAMAIGNIGVDASDGAKKQLEALKNDKEEMVRDAVKEALGKLQ